MLAGGTDGSGRSHRHVRRSDHKDRRIGWSCGPSTPPAQVFRRGRSKPEAGLCMPERHGASWWST